MAADDLQRSVRRALVVRLGAVAILLCLAFTAIAWFTASARLRDSVADLARLEAARFNQQVRGLLDAGTPTPADWQRALEELGRNGAATGLDGGRFVMARIYDATGSPLATLDDPAFPGIDALRAAVAAADFAPPEQADSRIVSRRLGEQTYVAAALALRDTSGEIRAWLGGAFAVSAAAMAELRAGVYRTLAYVIAIVLATAFALYPVIGGLVRRLAAAGSELLDANLETLQVLGSAIAKRDSDTDAHNYRVAVYSAKLGEAAGLPEKDMPALIKGALLHDVGKLGIRDAVLLKPGKLDDDEFRIMQSHVEHGLDITRRARWLEDAGHVVGAHHEKYDGGGYPAGLAADTIPVAARIFAIADVFDALTSERPYKQPLSLQESMAILSRGRGSHFDPQLLDCFDGIAATLHADYGDAAGDAARRELQALLDRYFRARVPGLGERG
jgi:HD-GYP domain-containing protein (c-di-GMP phosphodiesterase class II)